MTLLGFKLAGAKPDTEHPFGHGRIEYVSGLVVAAAILLMGYELVRDSIGKNHASGGNRVHAPCGSDPDRIHSCKNYIWRIITVLLEKNWILQR